MPARRYRQIFDWLSNRVRRPRRQRLHMPPRRRSPAVRRRRTAQIKLPVVRTGAPKTRCRAANRRHRCWRRTRTRRVFRQSSCNLEAEELVQGEELDVHGVSRSRAALGHGPPSSLTVAPRELNEAEQVPEVDPAAPAVGHLQKRTFFGGEMGLKAPARPSVAARGRGRGGVAWPQCRVLVRRPRLCR
jgi:hypothetical protein